LDDFKNLLPYPNYDVSATDLFTDVMRRPIERSASLTVLSHVHFDDQKRDLPSWVADWTAQPLHHLLVTSGIYHAAGISRSTYNFSDNGKSLHVLGKIIDTIQSLPKVADHSAYYFPYQIERALSGLRRSLYTAKQRKLSTTASQRK
jgi:hypothetical protein